MPSLYREDNKAELVTDTSAYRTIENLRVPTTFHGLMVMADLRAFREPEGWHMHMNAGPKTDQHYYLVSLHHGARRIFLEYTRK